MNSWMIFAQHDLGSLDRQAIVQMENEPYSLASYLEICKVKKGKERKKEKKAKSKRRRMKKKKWRRTRRGGGGRNERKGTSKRDWNFIYFCYCWVLFINFWVFFVLGIHFFFALLVCVFILFFSWSKVNSTRLECEL